jgi:hypothetical protein
MLKLSQKKFANFVTRSDCFAILCNNFFMRNNDEIRPLAGVPDHGFGLLGRLVHSILAEYAGAPLSVPRLHLGQNTLPDPPFPMPAEVPFGGDLGLGWLECGQSLATFLRTGIAALRSQPIPDISGYSEQIRIAQRVLRFDSIAMVWHDPGRAALPLVALAVDRAGYALAGWLPEGAAEADIEVTDDDPAADDLIVALLHELLQAQFEWTSTVFGLVP